MSTPGATTPATMIRPRPQISGDPTQNVVRVGQNAPFFADFYHDVLQMPWLVFLSAVFFAQIAANFLFALLFRLGGDCVANASGMLELFYFSVQTWATIGYGGMTPTTTWANMLVVVESAISTIFTAVATGLVFAKFARPTSRVLFSKKAVVGVRDGKRTLMFRVANERGNYVVEATARVTLVRDTITKEGEHMRRVTDLKLVRDVQPIFLFSWTVMHEIDADSPLADWSDEDLLTKDLRISVSLTAFDGTLSQTIHATHIYLNGDLEPGARLVDVMSTLPDGRLQIDFSRFHDTARIT